MERHIKLSNGQNIPLLGFGTAVGPTDKSELENSLIVALELGYRHFDTAFMYQNEHILGKVFHDWISSGKIKREELFVTTKLPPIGMKPSKVEHFLKKSLENLQLDYVDLYLIHWPVGIKYVDDATLMPMTDDGTMVAWDVESDFIVVWKAMEEQVLAGRSKSIGLSNFNASQVERIVKAATIPPVNLQVECNLYIQQKSLQEICRKHAITITAYASLGSPGRSESSGYPNPNLLEDPVLCKIAQSREKEPAQIALRFLVQQGIIAIPKSSNPKRIADIIAIFDFDLTEAEIEQLRSLDKGEEGRKFITSIYPGAAIHPERPFN